MPTSSNNIVEPHILNFQSRFMNILQHHRLRAVRPVQGADQERMLSDIWNAGRLDTDGGERMERLTDGHSGHRSWAGWRKIGLHADGEDPEADAPFLMEVDLFRDVGELGLQCLVSRHAV